jgi:pyridoxamine 5'-phosphate oxidase
MADDPFALFAQWMNDAQETELNDPDAVAVASVDAAGRPSVRIVLLRRFGPEGFAFFTNLDSRKGREISAHPEGALCIHWKSQRRQVRAEGPMHQVSDADADEYFASRGRSSRIGAHASLQSQPLESRAVFEARVAEASARFEGQDVPRPERWGGFRLVPRAIEFWSDREHRLHERRLFTRDADDAPWREGLLYP